MALTKIPVRVAPTVVQRDEGRDALNAKMLADAGVGRMYWRYTLTNVFEDGWSANAVTARAVLVENYRNEERNAASMFLRVAPKHAILGMGVFAKEVVLSRVQLRFVRLATLLDLMDSGDVGQLLESRVLMVPDFFDGRAGFCTTRQTLRVEGFLLDVMDEQTLVLGASELPRDCTAWSEAFRETLANVCQVVDLG